MLFSSIFTRSGGSLIASFFLLLSFSFIQAAHAGQPRPTIPTPAPTEVEALGSLVLACEAPLGPHASVHFEDISPESKISWDYSISMNGDQVTLYARNAGESLPESTELVIVTIIDPDSGYERNVLVGTDGGASLLVIADL